ncbi:hypothetical protein NQ314_020761 [Rhamnusium bicolor]|uniref:Uncharacterized protein n=1 Tax=Rhamnusium bicolor TaxID=1586634 RepID=A0AAV8WJW6_9CUCU|nr:hypothetical protein NQ314_020761 [Rhamnusium bicolor]
MSSLTFKNKKGTVIHRTTSETLRLGDDILNNHNQVRVSVQATSSRKKSQATSPSCSFQITGVSLTRYDIGDDSADDLDESHTDDISRVTDNETPSFSEDSRDTDDQPQQIVYTTATTVPQQQTAPKIDTETKWKEKETRDVGLGRFKVVKIESVVPFSRGRWTCFDYLDHTENSAKPSYVFCKQLGNDQPEILDTGKPRTCPGASFIDPNYVDVDDKQKRVPNTSAFWETNCQESYLYSGAIIMPDTTSLFPIPLTRPPKTKVRSSCPTTPNIIPMVRPIRSSRPFFTTFPSFDSVIKTTQNDKNVLINTCPAKNDVEIIKPQSICKEVVPQDLNKNADRVFTLASPKAFSDIECRNENLTGTMASSHRRPAESSPNGTHTTGSAVDAAIASELPLVVSDLNFNEATFFAVYCFIRNFVGASVSCTATIDTKIEHALDVVKNHLTHAVRLEVEELKIKINELVDRISYLEYENDLLRANVAPDVLANLGNTGGK